MQIISLFTQFFKTISNGILHGPNVIPDWHPLYGRKHYSWGTYKRKLQLYDSTTITVIIYRFYCPEERKTYSLLPFFITSYQRHINTVIEDCILGHILEKKSLNSLSSHPVPKYRTIRRWVNNFIYSIDYNLLIFEQYLCSRLPSYNIADSPLKTLTQKVIYLFDNVKHIINNSDSYHVHGKLSYINHAIAVETAKL